MFICVVGTIGYINKVNISNVQDIEFLHCAKNLHVVFNIDQKYTEKDQLWQKQNKNKTNTALVKRQPSGSMAQQLYRHTLPRGGHQTVTWTLPPSPSLSVSLHTKWEGAEELP